MKSILLTFFLVIVVLTSNTSANCPVTEKPGDVIECLSYISTGLYGAITKDMKRICRIAADISRCAKGQLGVCIAAEVGRAALSEIESIATNCCPNRNDANCPIRDTLLNDQRCFAADSLVHLANGQQKSIQQLRSGDAVLAFDHNTKTIVQSQVITMLDYQTQPFALFKHITTDNGRQLSLSSSHLIFTPNHDYIMAKDVLVDMDIYVMNQEGVLVSEKVSNVSDVMKQGYMAPLTEEGTLIVNEVAASCYATINSHRVAHMVLSPMRWWFRLFGMEMGGESMQAGIHWFPKMVFDVTAFLIPSIIQK